MFHPSRRSCTSSLRRGSCRVAEPAWAPLMQPTLSPRSRMKDFTFGTCRKHTWPITTSSMSPPRSRRASSPRKILDFRIDSMQTVTGKGHFARHLYGPELPDGANIWEMATFPSSLLQTFTQHNQAYLTVIPGATWIAGNSGCRSGVTPLNAAQIQHKNTYTLRSHSYPVKILSRFHNFSLFLLSCYVYSKTQQFQGHSDPTESQNPTLDARLPFICPKSYPFILL